MIVVASLEDLVEKGCGRACAGWNPQGNEELQTQKACTSREVEGVIRRLQVCSSGVWIQEISECEMD